MAQLKNLIVNGASRFIGPMYGDLVGTATSLPYGECSSATTAVGKEVTVPGVESLNVGTAVCVKFIYSNSVASPTLNVNSLGAKPIYQYGTTVASTSSATTGWNANSIVMLIYDGTGWMFNKGYNTNSTYTTSSVYVSTKATASAKLGTCAAYYAATPNSWCQVMTAYANTYAGPITLNINSKGAKPIYIDGEASSATNYTLPAGSYFVYYDGTNYYFRTDGKLTADITGNAATATTATKATQDGDGNVISSTYLKGITKAQVTTALGYTPPTATDISDAKKVATNYISSGTGSITIGNLTTTSSTDTVKIQALSGQSYINLYGANTGEGTLTLYGSSNIYIDADNSSATGDLVDFVTTKSYSTSTGVWNYRTWASGFVEGWYCGTTSYTSTGNFNITLTLPTALKNCTYGRANVNFGKSGDVQSYVHYVSCSTTQLDMWFYQTSSGSGWYYVYFNGYK